MRREDKVELAALSLLSYVPFLLSSPGQVSADSKQYLYLDPGGFLARASSLWDPHVGAGTVPHQHLGYLVPMGPWFWACDRLGVPDWVAQRLWLGSLSLVAVLGARWLFRRLGTGRVGALAGALVYGLSPYQLAFTARMSVLLLPWAALPWLVGLTMRVTRSGGWRAPAALALAVFAVGGVNATSLLLVATAPILWVVREATAGSQAARRVLAAAARAGLLVAGVCTWWGVGLRIQGAYGLPVLQLTEKVRTVAEASTPGDVLRGIGNWFFYGRDRVGYSIDQAEAYASNDALVALTYLQPALAVVAALALRWAHRAYFALLVAVGTVIAVGAWPHDGGPPYARLWARLADESSVALALRNTPRAVPVVVLGLAGLLAGAVGALPPVRWRRAGGVAVAALAVAGLAPVWTGGFLTDGMARPESIPAHWEAAADDLDRGDHGTRVLAVPGSSFAAYEWGTTVEPVTPGLTDRPFLAREVLPMGGPGTANLLAALDRRMQLGTFEPAAAAPLARLLAAGSVLLRADLDRSGRFDTPAPEPLWDALRAADGLAPPRTFGTTTAGGASLPAVAVFDVTDPRPIVRTAPADRPVVLAGDGDGLVDAAAAGLLDGSSLVLPVAALDDATLDAALDAGADLVLTDTNRRRIETWFYTLRDDRGQTERPGEVAPDPTGYGVRLDPFPGSGDDSRTVALHLGAQVDATGAGGPERPEHRAVRAVDGDVTTAWRVGGPDPRGQRLTIVPDEPVAASSVRLVQPSGSRQLARVRVVVNGGEPLDVDLGPASLEPSGQEVPIGTTEVQSLSIDVVETQPPAPAPLGADPVGLAEVRLGELIVAETIRPPVDLLDRVGDRLDRHALDIVLTRLRLDLADPTRQDDEPWLDRWVELPAARTFGVTGVARSHGHAGAAESTGGQAGCRGDLLALDGDPLPVRLAPGADGALTLAACEPVRLGAGPHRLVATPGAVSGIDVDRIVLSSEPGGGPTRPAPRGAPGASAGTRVEVVRSGDTALDVELRTDGEPFWLVLAQSENAGWHLHVDGARVGRRTLVDGYANGWLVEPEGPGTLAGSLRWRPQAQVRVGLAVSAAALVACVALVLRGRRTTAAQPPEPLAALCATPALAGPGFGPWQRPLGAAGVGVALAGVGALVAPPEIAFAAGAAAAVAALAPGGRLVLAGLGAAALLASRGAHRPSLAWLAVAVVAAGPLLDAVASRVRPARPAER